MIDPPTVFGLFRPRQPKLPSSGTHWGVALEMRYPVVCRVYSQLMLVFEQIRKYFCHFMVISAFSEKLMF